VTPRDPATLTETERFAEIAELLARGIQRLLAAEIKAATASRNSRDHLDEVADDEASCGSRVTGPRSKTA
jgi:hypothetical protein